MILQSHVDARYNGWSPFLCVFSRVWRLHWTIHHGNLEDMRLILVVKKGSVYTSASSVELIVQPEVVISVANA